MTLTLTPAPACFARCCALIGVDLTYPAITPATALDDSASAKRDGVWLAGCSVPRRAADVMLRNEKWPARSLGLVTPTHAQQVAAVLDKLGPTRALLVLLAAASDAAELLAVLDFEAELAVGRLHFAWDAGSLRAAFGRHPGVAVPPQLARLPDADAAAAAAVITWAKPALAALAAEQSARPGVTASGGAGRRVVVGRAFELWDDAGDALARALGGEVFDTDRPAQAAEAAAAEWAHRGDHVVAVDRPRPAWLAADRAWVAWLTRPAVPPFDARHPQDALLLADAAWLPLAGAAGWPAGRIAVAGWPAESVAVSPGEPAALLMNLPSLTTPKDVEDVTARRLVWEAVREELTRQPFAVGTDPAAYVARAPARLGLPADPQFPTARFVETLVGPAFAIGVARWLAGQNVAFTVHGRGWTDEADLAGRVRGPVESRAAYLGVLRASGGLIDPFLPGTRPAVAAAGVPAVRVFGRTPPRVLHDLTGLKSATPAVLPAAGPALSAAAIDALLR